jgi:hypothetical protein
MLCENRKYVDIYGPKGDKKVRLEFPKDKVINIKTSFVRRLELEHIQESIETLQQVPDFGYPIMLKDNDDESNYMRTWDLFLDLIQHGTKYERVENFIQAKHYEIKAER